MATNLSIECADRSVRWYLTPGQASRYEIIVINKSGDEHVDCTMSLDEPTEGGTFEPAAFTLRPRERKTVALTFAPDTQVPRDQITSISVRDAAGDVVASLERGLISAGGIDCTVQLSFKEPIMDGAAVRGFLVATTIKSLSATAGHFALQYTPHPSLEFVDVAAVALEPGQTQTVAVPILWNRAVKDSLGNNHPHVVEIGVAVSQGKRAGRLAWDTIESKLAQYAPPPPAPAAPAAPPMASAPSPVAQPYEAAQDEAAQYQPDPQEALPFFDASAPASAPPPPPAYTSPIAASAAPAPAPPAPAPPAPPAAYSQPPAAPATPAAQAPPVQYSSPPPAPYYAPPETPPAPAQPSYGDAQQYASAQPPPMAPAPAAPPDVRPPETDDALMSLLVGKPVSPPPGWRGPGRDAPDAPTQPPSIFARTPPTMNRPPQPAPPPPAPPPVAPPPPAPPVRAQPPTAAAPPPAGSVPPPWMPPPAPPRPAPQTPDGVPQPYRRTFTPPNAVAEEPPAQETEGEEEAIFGESPLESSVVGPPPSLARATEMSREQQRVSPRRTIDMPEPPPQRSHEGQLASLVIGGTAIIAIALMVFFYLRSTVAAPPAQVTATATAASTVPPAVVLETPRPAPSNVHRANTSPAPNASGQPSAAPSVAPSAAAHVAAQAAQQAVSTTAPTPRPAPTRQVALAPKPAHKPAPRPTRRPIPANPNLIVSMQGIDAHYGAGGHAIRVLWGANGQASALVQLTDEHGGVLSQTDVPGTRQSAVLYVPRTYRGSVVVQVVSIGAQGERVTQSMSLPAFGR